MSTLGTMVAEIRDEIRRTNFDTFIKRAIAAAVLFHRDKRFAWNESNFTFSTVVNQQTYTSTDSAALGRVAMFDNVKMVSPERVLEPRDIDFIRARISALTGLPENYGYYQNTLYLDPVPSTVVQINVLGLLELQDTTQPSGQQIITRENILTLANGYSTEWFIGGYDVIKAWAKWYLNTNALRNVAEAQNMAGAWGTLNTDQQDQLNSRGSSGFLTPTRF